MADETIYKRGDKGKRIAKELQPSTAKIRFQDRDIDIKTIIKIGRDDINDIVIKDDPLVSRKHALIEKEEEEETYYLIDKGSTNGTYLNNNPIPKQEKIKLKTGDVIMVGKTKLKLI